MARRIGSRFVDFLEDEAIKDDVDLLTVKRVLAGEIQARMDKKGLGPTELARRMNTGRDVVYRLLDEKDTGVTLKTLSSVARALETGLVDLLVAVERRAKGTSAKQRRK
jgi:antitoxin HicB